MTGLRGKRCIRVLQKSPVYVEDNLGVMSIGFMLPSVETQLFGADLGKWIDEEATGE